MIDKSTCPIGVFDSGVGGISVLRELVRLMPNEDYIYYGDSKRAPYGSKSLEEVRQLTEEHAVYLMEKGAKAIVIACNTATSADVSILRQKYPEIPIVGIEPALKPAVLEKEHPRVLAMATPMTIKEKKFQQLLNRYKDEAEIIPLPVQHLVEFVENGDLASEELTAYLTEIFAPYRDKPIDSVVLGCTHFPFAAAMIQRVLGDEVHMFDGGPGTARETRRRLEAAHLLNMRIEQGQVQFENSDETGDKIALSYRLLNSK